MKSGFEKYGCCAGFVNPAQTCREKLFFLYIILRGTFPNFIYYFRISAPEQTRLLYSHPHGIRHFYKAESLAKSRSG